MPKRKMSLSKPYAIAPGITQTLAEVEHVHFPDGFLQVRTMQGNTIQFPMTAQDNAFLESVENRVKAELEK